MKNKQVTHGDQEAIVSPAQERQYPLLYKNVTALSKEAHGNFYFEPPKDYTYAADMNAVFINASEIPNAMREYPIVFAKHESGVFSPFVLIGANDNKNRFLGDDGQWLANYIPAYVRRYPFIPAEAEDSNSEDQKMLVCIDNTYIGFNSDGRGEALFDEDGNESKELQKTITFLQSYYGDTKKTRDFCQKLDDLGIVEPMHARVELDGKEQTMGGFLAVNEEKLRALPFDKLGELAKDAYLGLVYAHIFSMANFESLFARCRAS